MARLVLATAAVGAVATFVPTKEENMNGKYFTSQTPHGDSSKFPTNYRDYPGGVKYFDVYSPTFSTLYSQVWWSALPEVKIPDEVVQRYAGGKGMAVVGFELDQVRRTPKGDVRVPINVAYNHHFESNMVGGKAKAERITLTGPEDPRIEKYGLNSGHNKARIQEGDVHWIVHDDKTSALPSHHTFGGANGGEVRKSFHGYAPGYAQVIESPKTFHITPMQIDTWNRDKMNLTGSPFVAGPLPRNSLAPPDAVYSGMLECPVSTRLRKLIDGGYLAITSGTCEDKIVTAAECFESTARQFNFAKHGVKMSNRSVSDSSVPTGCSIKGLTSGSAVEIFFNKATSGADCGEGMANWNGFTSDLVRVNVSVNAATDRVMIELSGPDGVWFGVGFNATVMANAPWTIVVDGTGKVTEHKLQDQSPGKVLATSVTVESSVVVAGQRTVVVSRPTKGKSADYYSFTTAGQLNFLNAVGNTSTFSYHKLKSPSSITLLPSAGAGACVCASDPAPFGQGKGFLSYEPTNQTGERGRPTKIGFNNHCAKQPASDLLAMKNPTCDVRTYVGGQISCHHMFSLLDADQDIPWPDQPLEYVIKFRFWYQDYNASYHNMVNDQHAYGIASPVEYDVPKCEEGMMGCSKATDGTWIHTITGNWEGSGKLIAAHFHCHAPTCLSFGLWRNDTGELLCMERPIYGGNGVLEPDYDEKGFILQPPCLWGDKEFGLEPPLELKGIPLRSVKTSIATNGHHGEMAWQQLFFAS